MGRLSLEERYPYILQREYSSFHYKDRNVAQADSIKREKSLFVSWNQHSNFHMKTNKQLRSSQNTGNQTDLNNWFFSSVAEWTKLKLFRSTCSLTFLIFSFCCRNKAFFFFFVVPLMWTELFIRFQMTHKGFFMSFILFLKSDVDVLISTHLFKGQSWIFQL